MIYQLSYASPLLQPFVLRYYGVCGYGSERDPYLEATLPNGYTSLVFHFEEKIAVSNVSYDGDDIPHFYIFGKYTRPVFVRHTFGSVDVFGVIFRPGAFHYLMAESQHALTDILVDVRDGFGKGMNAVLDKMYSDKTLEGRKALIEAFFLKRLRDQTLRPNVVDGVLQQIMGCHGKVRVEALCKKFRITRQHLNRLFQHRIGLSVKQYACIIRFNCMLRAMNQSPETDLLQLAVDFDYTDESHLIKDFHHFTGGKPSAFLSRENQLAKFLLNR